MESMEPKEKRDAIELVVAGMNDMVVKLDATKAKGTERLIVRSTQELPGVGPVSICCNGLCCDGLHDSGFADMLVVRHATVVPAVEQKLTVTRSEPKK